MCFGFVWLCCYSNGSRATDQGELNTVTYYRLKQTDFDGKYTYSKVVQVYQDQAGGFANVFPNPAQGKVFKVDGFNVKQLIVEVYNIAGHKVAIKSRTTDFSWGIEGEYEFVQQNSGLFIVVVQTNKGVFKERLLVN